MHRPDIANNLQLVICELLLAREESVPVGTVNSFLRLCEGDFLSIDTECGHEGRRRLEMDARAFLVTYLVKPSQADFWGTCSSSDLE
jgi:hypothetical protein